jgi:hypothetical protein
VLASDGSPGCVALVCNLGCCVAQEARRGHLTTTKSNEQAVKSLKSRTASRISAGGSSQESQSPAPARVALPSMSEDKLIPEEPTAGVSRYSPIQSESKRDGDDEYADDAFEPDVESPQQQKLALLRKKRAAGRRSRVSRSSVEDGKAPFDIPAPVLERVSSLDKLAVLGDGSSSTKARQLRGRAGMPTAPVQQDTRTPLSLEDNVSPARRSRTRSRSSDVLMYVNGGGPGHRVGFGFAPNYSSPTTENVSPARGGVASDPIIVHSPVPTRLIRTPEDGQLPNLSVRICVLS